MPPPPFRITAEHLHSSLTVIFPLQLLLDLLGAGAVWAHESQQPLLEVGRRSETETGEEEEEASRTEVNSTDFVTLCLSGLTSRCRRRLFFVACVVHGQGYLAGPSDDGVNWEFLSRKSRRPRSSRITDSRSSRLTLLSSCMRNHEGNKGVRLQ